MGVRHARRGGLMFARVATFENRDMTRVDELVEIVPLAGGARTRSPAPSGTSCCSTHATGRLSVSRSSTPRTRSGRRARVREARRRDPGDRARPAYVGRPSTRSRSTTWTARPGTPAWPRSKRARAARRALHSIREQAIAEADELDGWRGIVTLVDRTTGVTKTITLLGERRRAPSQRDPRDAAPLPRRRRGRWLDRERPRLRRRGQRGAVAV